MRFRWIWRKTIFQKESKEKKIVYLIESSKHSKDSFGKDCSLRFQAEGDVQFHETHSCASSESGFDLFYFQYLQFLQDVSKNKKEPLMDRYLYPAGTMMFVYLIGLLTSGTVHG